MPPSTENPVSQVHRGCGMVLGEATFGKPSKEEYEAMARRRYQDPKPKLRGKWWSLLYWQDEFKDGRRIRKRKRIRLAPATMGEREARKVAAETLRPLNQGLEIIGSATKFQDFVEEIYIPVTLPLMAKSTQARYRGIIRNYLTPNFGKLCLRDMTVLTLQKYFSGMADSHLAHGSRDKIRDVLSSILASTVTNDFLVKNPVEKVKLPRSNTPIRSKPYITPNQFVSLMELIAEPYATMVYVAIYTGLRVSELIGLRWRNVRADAITIEERYCRGDFGPPKSEASAATIAVNRAVIERIFRLKTLTVEVKAGRAVRKYAVVKSDRPDDLVFQSLAKGRPMRDNNILTRHIKPAARKLGLDFVNWRCLRTSHATWLKLAGADPKDAQAQMRHSRVTTTLEIYQQFVPESQRKVVDKLTGLAGSTMVN